MKAMILAAGRGERMMPLTKNIPKPMLTVGGKPLIQHHIENLVRIGITDIVINHAWCGDKITQYLGDGSTFGATIQYSDESNGALETAGGIIKALPLLVDMQQPLHLNNEMFLVINGDVFTEINLTQLPILTKDQQVCLWLTKNPQHNCAGDFVLANEYVNNKTHTSKQTDTLTFSGVALYKACFFASHTHEKNKLALGPLLKESADKHIVKGLLHQGYWVDVGTPERLLQVNQVYNLGNELLDFNE